MKEQIIDEKMKKKFLNNLTSGDGNQIGRTSSGKYQEEMNWGLTRMLAGKDGVCGCLVRGKRLFWSTNKDDVEGKKVLGYLQMILKSSVSKEDLQKAKDELLKMAMAVDFERAQQVSNEYQEIKEFKEMTLAMNKEDLAATLEWREKLIVKVKAQIDSKNLKFRHRLLWPLLGIYDVQRLLTSLKNRENKLAPLLAKSESCQYVGGEIDQHAEMRMFLFLLKEKQLNDLLGDWKRTGELQIWISKKCCVMCEVMLEVYARNADEGSSWWLNEILGYHGKFFAKWQSGEWAEDEVRGKLRELWKTVTKEWQEYQEEGERWPIWMERTEIEKDYKLEMIMNNQPECEEQRNTIIHTTSRVTSLRI